MKIRELRIEGFKSIGEIKLVDPNPFSVFIGANASGKSNIFEALEFIELCDIMDLHEVPKLFGNTNELFNLSTKNSSDKIIFNVNLGHLPILLSLINNSKQIDITIENFGYKTKRVWREFEDRDEQAYIDYGHFTNFLRLFVSKSSIVKRKLQDDLSLASDASNLEKVLKRILKNEKNKDEIIELLQLLVPGFSNVEIRTEELSGSDNLLIYENALNKPLPRHLISDGTYNILAIIAAIYQSDVPQFLCIEEPENGLNPKVVRQLVSLFRDKCKEKGHYIWLNTHSQTLVSELTTDEIILVDKVGGLTQTRQIKGMDLHGMRMDEALLTNALGGGIPW